MLVVHALGQSANFHTDRKLDPEKLKAELNTYLPEDIGVVRVEEVPERFHSRLNALGKTYRYRVATGEGKNVFERKQIYPLNQPLDVEAAPGERPFWWEKKIFAAFLP